MAFGAGKGRVAGPSRLLLHRAVRQNANRAVPPWRLGVAGSAGGGVLGGPLGNRLVGDRAAGTEGAVREHVPALYPVVAELAQLPQCGANRLATLPLGPLGVDLLAQPLHAESPVIGLGQQEAEQPAGAQRQPLVADGAVQDGDEWVGPALA